jgi:hypothetical protein
MFQHIYASEQKLDQYVLLAPLTNLPLILPLPLCSARYNSVYSDAREEIRQSGLWDNAAVPRTSIDEFTAPGYPQQHGRQMSGLRNEIGRPEPSQEYLSEVADGKRGAGEYPSEQRFEPPMAGGNGYGYEGEDGYGAGGGGGQPPYYPQQSHNAYAQPTPIETNFSEPEGWRQASHPMDGIGGRKAPKVPSPTETDTGNLGWDPAYHR